MSDTNKLVLKFKSPEAEAAFNDRTREAIAAFGPSNRRCIEACEREINQDFRHHGRRAKVRRVAP